MTTVLRGLGLHISGLARCCPLQAGGGTAGQTSFGTMEDGVTSAQRSASGGPVQTPRRTELLVCLMSLLGMRAVTSDLIRS